MIDGVHKVKIQATLAGIGSRVWLDDVELHGVTNISFELGVDKITTCTITFHASLETEATVQMFPIQDMFNSEVDDERESR